MPTLFASSEKNVQWIKVVTNDSIGTCSSELYSFNLLKLPPPPRAAILVGFYIIWKKTQSCSNIHLKEMGEGLKGRAFRVSWASQNNISEERWKAPVKKKLSEVFKHRSMGRHNWKVPQVFAMFFHFFSDFSELSKWQNWNHVSITHIYIYIHYYIIYTVHNRIFLLQGIIRALLGTLRWCSLSWGCCLRRNTQFQKIPKIPLYGRLLSKLTNTVTIFGAGEVGILHPMTVTTTTKQLSRLSMRPMAAFCIAF